MGRLLRLRLLRQWLAAAAALFTLSAAVGVLPASATPPVAQRPAVTSAAPDLSITSVSPAIAVPNQPVTIVGTVTAGASALSNPRVTAGLGYANLNTASDLQQWTAGRSSLETRQAVGTTLAPLVAGSTRQFTLILPAAAFPSGYRNASFPLLLTLLDGTSSAPKRSWRTTISFVGQTPSVPIPVTWLVPLTLPADAALFGPRGAARDAAWARAIGPGSRVSSLLDTLSGQPITWVVDPAITAPAASADPTVPAAGAARPGAAQSGASSTGPTSSTGSPSSSTPSGSSSTTAPEPTSSAAAPPPTATSTVPSSGTTSASPDQSGSSSTTSPSESTTPGGTTTPDPVEVLTGQLRERLRSLPATQSVLWTAQDDPDLAALATSGPRGQQILREEVGRTLRPDMAAVSTAEVAWPVDGVTAADVRTITGAWSSARKSAPVLVLPTDGITGDDNATSSAQRSISGTSGALLYNQQLSSLVGSGSSDPGLRAQQFLAQSLAIYDERPAIRRSLAVAVPRAGGATPAQLASVISTIRKAPWLSDGDGTNVMQAASSAPSASVRSTRAKVQFPEPGTSAVSSAALTQISVQRGQLSGLNSLLVNSLDVISDRLHLVDNLGSTRWRGRLVAATQASQYSGAALTKLLEAVSVSPSPVNFFTDRGTIAITVVNTLNREVRGVQVLLRPRAISLKVEQQPQPVSLRAGARGLVRPQLAAAGSGTVPVDVVVETANGVRLGKPTQRQANLEVNVRPTATWIYWVLGGVATLILFAGIVRSIRRGPRGDSEKSLPSTDQGRTPDDAIVAGPTTTARSLDEKTTENDQDE